MCYIYIYICTHVPIYVSKDSGALSKVIKKAMAGQGARKSQTNLPHHLGLSKPWGQMASTKSGNHGRWHENDGTQER